MENGKGITAEAFLARLAERGVEYVFANAGTDFAPIIEALSRKNRKYPRFITVPHENVAMAMANGYYRMAGKPAAVMVHVTVGTANTVCGLMNMARDNVPVMLCAGRTPITETGHEASRNGAIHWGQESFDQGGMVREFVKWDYELRTGQPAGALVDRALDIAMSEPRGPVYMCLPREVLASEAVPMRRDNVRPLGVEPAAPSHKSIEEAARILAKAEYPLIVTAAAGRSVEAFEALAALAKDFAIPVVQPAATDLSLSTDHPMFCGFELGSHLADADAVLVINAGVPWMPRLAKPKP
ncbi:MAG: decarboxylase, partial [Xanthobacteraceae bacterium]|nr:decarboxylase [Xanthobacteraceae bacterium]